MEAAAHELTWVTAAPLWHNHAADRVRMRRPALLRFTSDTFMEDLLGELDHDPARLAARVMAPGPGIPLKLYQPTHGHFHLIAASLVCQLPGLPDHAVDAAREERAELVLRRLAGDDELAWIPGPDPGTPGVWQRVADVEALAEREELLPLFPGAYINEDGLRRRLLFGLVPTSSRETFHAAEVSAEKVGDDGETVVESPTSADVVVPKLGTRAGAFYVVRCVYRKPRCYKERPLLSDPSERFMIAAYFDPDAPARSIRIAMPMSFGEIYNAKRNVGIVISDSVRARLSKITYGIFGDPAKTAAIAPDEGAGLGMVCSLSIPIVTTVAMIILMIVANILDLIFRWIGYIVVCLPINLKEPPEPAPPPPPK